MQLLRPHQPAGSILQVIGPTADMRNTLGFGQTAFLLPQRIFRLFALGDVPGNFGSADNDTIAIPDWGNGHRNVYRRAVFPDPHRFEVFNALATPDASEDV